MPNPFENTTSVFPDITQAVGDAYDENLSNGMATDVEIDETGIEFAANKEADKMLAKDFAIQSIRNTLDPTEDNPDPEIEDVINQMINEIAVGDSELTPKWLAHGIAENLFQGPDSDSAWRIVKKMDGKLTSESLAAGINKGNIIGKHLTEAMRIIEKDGNDEAAGYLAQAIKRDRLSAEDVKKSMSIIENFGTNRAIVDLSYCLENTDFAKKYCTEALDLITQRGGSGAASGLSYNLYMLDLDDDAMDKALKFIEGNCSDMATQMLALNLFETKYKPEFLARILEMAGSYGGEKTIEYLENQINFGALNDDNEVNARAQIEKIKARLASAKPEPES